MELTSIKIFGSMNFDLLFLYGLESLLLCLQKW